MLNLRSHFVASAIRAHRSVFETGRAGEKARNDTEGNTRTLNQLGYVRRTDVRTNHRARRNAPVCIATQPTYNPAMVNPRCLCFDVDRRNLSPDAMRESALEGDGNNTNTQLVRASPKDPRALLSRSSRNVRLIKRKPAGNISCIQRESQRKMHIWHGALKSNTLRGAHGTAADGRMQHGWPGSMVCLVGRLP